ncbi:MAG: hypothetical protein ACM36B_01515 [Bacteroidota bacterium]
MLTYTAKLLLVPALVVLATIGLLTFLACRGLIGLCGAREPEEDPAS